MWVLGRKRGFGNPSELRIRKKLLSRHMTFGITSRAISQFREISLHFVFNFKIVIE